MERELTCRYFAYGSNMSTGRLRARVPSARAQGRGLLPNHVLRWHKIGRDGSGKCDVVPADSLHAPDASDVSVASAAPAELDLSGTSNVVWGVLYDVPWAEKPTLDAAEGLGVGYFEKQVRIVTDDGECLASTYHANPDRTDASLRPLDWYKDHVVRGAREHGLPADYIRSLEEVET